MAENQVHYICDQCDKTYIRKHFFENHMKSKHGHQQDIQLLDNTLDAARPPQINLDPNSDRVFFEDLDIPDDIELFEDIASDEEIARLPEDIESSLAEICGECSIKDRYVNKIKLKLKAFEKSKRLKTHIDQNHFKYICKQCNISFPDKIGHDVHMNKKHSEITLHSSCTIKVN